jgi:predicted AAA+ superfamily ATPase
MDIKRINQCLAEGAVDQEGIFPKVDQLETVPYIFTVNFGLQTLPTEAGIILIRGARQYGKSTWLEQQVLATIKQFGAGSAYYLNGDSLLTPETLEHELMALLQSFRKGASVKRIFIDEITAIEHWERALKKLADQGYLIDVLIVTTGSKATDLRRGTEKLPGRKGKLAKTTYWFTPVSYGEFKRVCGKKLGTNTLVAYLLSGGSPIACTELALHGCIPEYVIDLTRGWVEGEVAASGRSRVSLHNLMQVLFRFGGTPVGQAKLAREAALANNTIAANYIELLNDLGAVVPQYPWDQDRGIPILRKPCKYPFMNLLVAVAYHPARLRTPEDFLNLSPEVQGCFYEWLMAQELMRRFALEGREILAPLLFWQNAEHEVDYVITSKEFLEVKRGASSQLEFSWFAKQFPKAQLTVVNTKSFGTDTVTGVSFEHYLSL